LQYPFLRSPFAGKFTEDLRFNKKSSIEIPLIKDALQMLNSDQADGRLAP